MLVCMVEYSLVVASIFSFWTMGQWEHWDFYTASTFCISCNIVSTSKRKENAVATSQAREVKGKTHCHQSNRLLRREREREALVRSREQRLVA